MTPLFLIFSFFIGTAEENLLVSDAKIVEAREKFDKVVVLDGSLTFGGEASGLYVLGGDVVLGPTSKINEEVFLFGGKIEAKNGASLPQEGIKSISTDRIPFFKRLIEKLAESSEFPDFFHKSFGSFATSLELALRILQWMLVLAAAFFCFLFFPKKMENIQTEILLHPWRSLMTGFLSIAALFVTLIILALTVVGIVAIPFVLFGMGLLFLIGVVAVTRSLGLLVFRKAGPFTATMIGLLVGLVLNWIPVIGGFVWFFLVFVGLGASVWGLFWKNSQPPRQVISENYYSI